MSSQLTVLLRELVRESAVPLACLEECFAVDSTGFSTCVYDRWFDEKYGGKKKSRKRWVKAHVICGVNTNVVTDVIVAEGDTGDAPQLPELVSNTAQRFTLAEVSADKAYLSHANFAAIESVGAVPYVPFKVGSTGGGPDLWRKMWGAVRLPQRRVQAALPRAQQRRGDLLGDQAEVRGLGPVQGVRRAAQ